MNKEYLVTVNSGLAENAPVVYVIGTFTSVDDAHNAASNWIKTASCEDRQMVHDSYYTIGTIFSNEPHIVGLDYGSYSRFIIIKEI